MPRRNLGRFLLAACAAFASSSASGLRGEDTPPAPEEPAKKPAKSLHEFKVKDIDGKDVALASFRGQVLLVVNVASQ